MNYFILVYVDGTESRRYPWNVNVPLFFGLGALYPQWISARIYNENDELQETITRTFPN